MLKVLEERNLPITELIPVASERSVGKKITFKGQEYAIVSMQEAIDRKPEIALFSAGEKHPNSLHLSLLSKRHNSN